MTNQEIMVKALELSLNMVKPEDVIISRDERGNILLSRELYDTMVNLIRLFNGKFGDERIINGETWIHPLAEDESE